jgi:hypothetical protein
VTQFLAAARAAYLSPHVEKRASTGYEHLTDAGIVVPANSHPAHIQFNWRHNSLKQHLEGVNGQLPQY